MHLKRRIVAGPRELPKKRVTDLDGRGVDDVPILHPAEGAWQIDLLDARIGQRPLGQGLHELFERLVEPPIERRARDAWHLGLQVGAQDVCLIGTARRPRRDDHRPHQHPDLQLALPLDHATLLTQAYNLLLREQLLKHRAYVVACHGLSPPGRLSQVSGRGVSAQGVDHSAVRKSRRLKWRSALG
jgi:hypothetical protein